MVEYFKDRRYRQNRILMVIMIPLALVLLAGVGELLYRQQNPRRLVGRENFSLPTPNTSPNTSPGAMPGTTPSAMPDALGKRIEEAVLAFRTGDSDGARKLLEGIDLEKAGVSAGWELAGLLKERGGDKKAASERYSRGIATVPSEGLYYRRAILRRENGEFDLALDDLNQALVLAPADILLSNDRLLLLIQMGHKQQASEEIKALNALGTDGSGRVFALCGLLLEDGEYAQGASVLEACKKVLPPHVFDQMLKNPILSRHQGHPEIMPFYIKNL